MILSLLDNKIKKILFLCFFLFFLQKHIQTVHPISCFRIPTLIQGTNVKLVVTGITAAWNIARLFDSILNNQNFLHGQWLEGIHLGITYGSSIILFGNNYYHHNNRQFLVWNSGIFKNVVKKSFIYVSSNLIINTGISSLLLLLPKKTTRIFIVIPETIQALISISQFFLAVNTWVENNRGFSQHFIRHFKFLKHISKTQNREPEISGLQTVVTVDSDSVDNPFPIQPKEHTVQSEHIEYNGLRILEPFIEGKSEFLYGLHDLFYARDMSKARGDQFQSSPKEYPKESPSFSLQQSVHISPRDQGSSRFAPIVPEDDYKAIESDTDSERMTTGLLRERTSNLVRFLKTPVSHSSSLSAVCSSDDESVVPSSSLGSKEKHVTFHLPK